MARDVRERLFPLSVERDQISFEMVRRALVRDRDITSITGQTGFSRKTHESEGKYPAIMMSRNSQDDVSSAFVLLALQKKQNLVYIQYEKPKGHGPGAKCLSSSSRENTERSGALAHSRACTMAFISALLKFGFMGTLGVTVGHDSRTK